MLKVLVLLCVVGAVVTAPQPAKSYVEDLKEYLLKATKVDDGPTLEEAMSKAPWANAWENSGKYQGDILLTDQQVEEMVAEATGAKTGLINTRHRWPGNTVIYEIASGHFNANQIQQIEAAFNMFNTRTCVRFRRRTNERDFVRVTGFNDGCYAHVGYWPGFVTNLNLAWPGCSNSMIIIHEWLHTVGFNHMHQTYSRDNYVVINWGNVQQGMNYAFDIFSNREVTMLGLPYEYASNQHYGRFAFSRNGQPTIVPRWNDNGQMGQLQFVTGWDLQRVNRLYNCPGAWSADVRAQHADSPAYTREEHDAYLRTLESHGDEDTGVNK